MKFAPVAERLANSTFRNIVTIFVEEKVGINNFSEKYKHKIQKITLAELKVYQQFINNFL
jgi:hypothetical protein